jgi:O-antigen/teichoic acid export membrane protein
MVSHTLSVEDIGIVYSIIGLMSILSSYNDLGLTEALQYYLPHYLIDKAYDKAKTLLIFTRGVQILSGLVVG